MQRRIVFLWPGYAYTPIGGYRVGFEYGNHLAEQGWEVIMIFPAFCKWKEVNLKEKFKAILRFFYVLLLNKIRPKWFPLNEKIKCRLVPSLGQYFIPESEAYVATAKVTADYLVRYKTNARKFYLIQGFENWQCSDHDVLASYRYPFIKLTISRWLYEIVSKYDYDNTFLLLNGFNFQEFYCTVPIKKRTDRVAVLYHTQPEKDFKNTFEALNLAKKKYPQLKVSMFGVFPRPHKLPEWIEYKCRPSRAELRNIYNNSAVYLAGSRSEGWGLTIGEAMLCGCAICCTDCNGFREMVTNHRNGLLAPVQEPMKLADNLVTLLRNPDLRYRLAQQGLKDISNFSWEQTFKTLDHILEQYLCEEHN